MTQPEKDDQQEPTATPSLPIGSLLPRKRKRRKSWMERSPTQEEQQLIEAVAEKIRPSHWIGLGSYKRRELDRMVERAGRVLDRICREYPGLRYSVVGSINEGEAEAHVHGFLWISGDADLVKYALKGKWAWGGKVFLQEFDPLQEGMRYVVQQMERGEILWSDGSPPDPIPVHRNARSKAVKVKHGRERRRMNKRLRSIERHDRLRRAIRKEQLRRECLWKERLRKERLTQAQLMREGLQRPAGSETGYTPPVELVAQIRGRKPLRFKLIMWQEGQARWEPGPLSLSLVLERLNSGDWELPELAGSGEPLGCSAAWARRWLGLREYPKPLGYSRPMLNDAANREAVEAAQRQRSRLSEQPLIVVNDWRDAALVVVAASPSLERSKESWMLKLADWSAELHLRSEGLTDAKEAIEAARDGLPGLLKGIACIAPREIRVNRNEGQIP